MNLLKQIVCYLTWSIIAIVFGIVYMRIVLGANITTANGIGYLFSLFYNWGLFHIGVIVGVVITILFILIDVFYLKKKQQNNLQLTITRLACLIIIAMFVGTIHYMLEKVIDII